jgi:hypothetical protein
VDVFYRMGQRMGIPEVPGTYAAWQQARQAHLDNDLVVSDYTADLYRQYRRHLGAFRYALVLQAQRFVTPPRVRELLQLGRRSWLPLVLPLYRPTQHMALGRWARASLMPAQYRAQILALDRAPELVSPRQLQAQ